MSIQFHDPRAEPSHPVEAYRLKAALDGPIAIGLLANGFPDSVEFLDAVEAVLGESLPEASFHRYDKGGPLDSGHRPPRRRDRRTLRRRRHRLRALRELHFRHRA